MKSAFGIFLIQLILLISPELFAQETINISNQSSKMDFSYLRDTVYTLKPYFIEVNLSTQKGYLYSRTDSVTEFGISSGTQKLEDGVETKTGLYVIQVKMEKWYSRQFDSTLMLNWMGFNWGIGFHALQGRGYYKYLGKKKSSHGCIRLSRETALSLFNKIEEGTPVLIHNGFSAVKIKFGNPDEALTYLDNEGLIYQLKKEYKEMYSGKYFISYNPKLLIDFNNVYHEGLPIGDSRKITKFQITFPVSEFIESSTPVPHGCMLIDYPTQKIEISYDH